MRCVFIEHIMQCKQCKIHISACEQKKLEMIPENAEEFERGLCEKAKTILRIGTIIKAVLIANSN